MEWRWCSSGMHFLNVLGASALIDCRAGVSRIDLMHSHQTRMINCSDEMRGRRQKKCSGGSDFCVGRRAILICSSSSRHWMHTCSESANAPALASGKHVFSTAFLHSVTKLERRKKNSSLMAASDFYAIFLTIYFNMENEFLLILVYFIELI